MQAGIATKRAIGSAQPWLDTGARIGYAAKGVVFGLIGLLALLAGMRHGGAKTNQSGAINTLGSLPLGHVLLLVVAVGLFAYAAWRLLFAALNPEGSKPLKRLGYVASAVAYGGFAWTALALAITGSPAQSHPERSARTAMALPFGSYLVLAVALGLGAVAIAQWFSTVSLSFEKQLKVGEMSSQERTAARWLGRVGFAARGVLFGLMGWGLARAALHKDPSEAGGFDRALQLLSSLPFGRILLALVGAGLLCYGFYLLFEARFRKMALLTNSQRTR